MRQEAVESGQQPEPLRQTDLTAITGVFGGEKLEDEALVAVCDKYGLEQWPHTRDSRCKPDTWRLCLEASPVLRQRLVQVNEDELRKMFQVGQLIKRDTAHTPEQVTHHHQYFAPFPPISYTTPYHTTSLIYNHRP